MKRLSLLLALLLVQPVWCQDDGLVMGGAYSAEAVANAKNIIEQSTPKTLTLAVGEYKMLIPDKTVTGPMLWASLSSKCLELIDIEPNKPFAAHLKLKGEPAAKLHKWAAQPYRRVLVGGAVPGAVTVVMVVNGKTPTDPPAIIDQLDVTVPGSTPPKPVDPVDPNPVDPVPDETDTLVKAARADIKAGKGTVEDVQILVSTYRSMAKQIRNMDKPVPGTPKLTLNTMEDFNHVYKETVKTMLGDPAVVLPGLRMAIRDSVTNPAWPDNPNDKFADYKDKVISTLDAVATRLSFFSK